LAVSRLAHGEGEPVSLVKRLYLMIGLIALVAIASDAIALVSSLA